MPWTDLDEKRLLVALVQEIVPTVSSKQWEAVAKKLGRGDTASAVMQHYNKKLKNTPLDDNPGTPKSAKTRKVAKAESASGRKRKKVDNSDSDGNADDETPKPTKRGSAAKAKTTSGEKGHMDFKAESGDDEDVFLPGFDPEDDE